MLHTHKPQTDEAVKAMQARTAKRVAIVKRVMGAKYLCHPVNQVQRKDAPLNVILVSGDSNFLPPEFTVGRWMPV